MSKSYPQGVVIFGCAYFIDSYPNSTNKSYAFECSVSQCEGFSFSIAHSHGDIQVSNMNTSYNHASMASAYRILNEKEVGYMNFTTVSNMHSQYLVAFSEGSFIITKCNYFNNSCLEWNSAIIYCSWDSKFSDCSFLGNEGSNLFVTNPNIDNCYFDENTVYQTVFMGMMHNYFRSIEPLDSYISHYTTEKCSVTYFYKKDISVKKLHIKDIKKIVINVYKTYLFNKIITTLQK